MFDSVARRYDLVNDVLSVGQDRLWRRAVARAVDALPGERVLDLAAGTGTSSITFARRGAFCVACDFSLGMLQEGRRRYRDHVVFVAGDGLSLPFADGVFDVVTCSFGLRNVADVDQALRECLRVTRRGGRLVICEFSTPPSPLLRRCYDLYLRLIPAIGSRIGSNPGSYRYLAESIRGWPDQRELAERIQAAGWSAVAWRNLSGGVVSIHRAVRP
ncbi:MAG: demethylmenaquinone methyltransferase [Acidothermus sp.]|nr:demethylmenaquinone methyltransferase [Acidothermus sp.]MCL6537831.1 demethylmenaquinone methyltransferase [Acidothermus sp.]